MEKFYKLPLKKFATSEPQFLPYDEFKDAVLYSSELIVSICETNPTTKRSEQMDEIELAVQIDFRHISDILLIHKGEAPILSKAVEKHQSETAQVALEVLKDILSKPRLLMRDRKRAIGFVRMLEIGLPQTKAERV